MSGKLDNGGWVLASESCALDHIGATYLRELEPGETIIIDSNGLRSFIWGGERHKAQCIFEFIYFARPDTILDNRLVYPGPPGHGSPARPEHPVEADVVIGIPDSATAAAVGYSQESGIPYSEGLVKNRYVGRTFIEPTQHFRNLGVRMKFNPLPEVISGKRIIVVDDSIVRGTTTPHVVALLRRAGAVECPPPGCAPRLSAIPAISASTWPPDRSSWPTGAPWPRSANWSRQTLWATSASTACSRPSTATPRDSAPPALRGTTPCPCSLKWTSLPWNAPSLSRCVRHPIPREPP